MDENLKNAIVHILGTLPKDARVSFYWHNGRQSATFEFTDSEPIHIALVRDTQGIGHVVPNLNVLH